ncbi:hypothetical protein MiAbW_02343 [Microcystis aeruginosa NIES-4325]|uniref:Uncharacterized protein n=1 Tax=Microcystis aeruginosa NIES-4325 TaxID=2569534 RepID=A0A5J4F909_MICAE|nr:heterocyst frequency control protein PatD [Microcystis aeruginosa]GEA27776.1 hypothetical protein MiAbW_02343 [Microcystis aeruginosa NIES-4325]
MLPKNYRQAYESLLRKLEDFSLALLDGDVPTGSKSFQALQTCLAGEILSLNDDNFSPEVANRWRAVQTELYRSWRLLETDWFFLASARQGREKRLQIISDRVATLKGYCRVLLGAVVD